MARREEGRQSLTTRGARLDRYVRSLLEHDTESTERDIAWLDSLISAERLALVNDSAERADDTTGGTR